MFEKYTVAHWMEQEGIPSTADAAKYEVGQNLTYAQAREIIHMVRQGMGFQEDHPGRTESWTRCGDPYRKVIFMYAALIKARKKWKSNWDRMLWIALDEEDQTACNEVSRDYFAYKFNMTRRLKEIYEQQPTGYKIPKKRFGWR